VLSQRSLRHVRHSNDGDKRHNQKDGDGEKRLRELWVLAQHSCVCGPSYADAKPNKDAKRDLQRKQASLCAKALSNDLLQARKVGGCERKRCSHNQM